MHRRTYAPSYGIVLKSGIGFKVKTGYAMYDSWLPLGTPISNSWKTPVYAGESSEMEFYWYDVDSATRLAAGVVSLATALLAFF